MKGYVLVVLLLLSVPNAAAMSFQDPTLEACKKAFDVSVMVQGMQVYFEDCYGLMVKQGRIPEEMRIPTITAMGLPIMVKMTATVPLNMRFYPSYKQDGTKYNIEGRETGRTGSTKTLEYVLKEPGYWRFIAETDLGPEFIGFNIGYTSASGIVMSSGGAVSSDNAIDIRVEQRDGGYDDGDTVTFMGSDVNNPNIRVQYAGVETTPSEGIIANRDNQVMRVYDLTGQKGELSRLRIPFSEPFWSMDNKTKSRVKWAVAIFAVIGVILLGIVVVAKRSRRSRGFGAY